MIGNLQTQALAILCTKHSFWSISFENNKREKIKREGEGRGRSFTIEIRSPKREQEKHNIRYNPFRSKKTNVNLLIKATFRNH